MDAFAFLFEYDSDEDVDVGDEVGSEIESGFPQPELSVEDPDVTSLVGFLYLLSWVSFWFVVDLFYEINDWYISY